MDDNLATIRKPNQWVAKTGDSTTQLVYALQIDPAPLTVSLPNQEPVLASLLFVITNQQPSDIEVTSINFTLQIGDDADSLTDASSNSILYTVSDTVDWQLTPPSSVSSGPATFTLAPATGSSVTLAAGASVTVQLFQIAVNEAVGTTAINIKEITGGSQLGFPAFEVTKFPYGFYFNALVATVPSGSTNVPVAQVAYDAPVTLIWNSSVMEPSAYTVYYATNEGQQSGTVTTAGEWVSPPLTRDTVFTVVVQATSVGGQPVTVALSTEVSVQQPDVVAGSVSAASANVSGALSAGSLAAGGVTISEGGDVLVLNTGSLAVEGETSLNNATIDGPVAVNGNVSLDGQMTLNGAAIISGPLTVESGGQWNAAASIGVPLTVTGNVSMMRAAQIVKPGTYTALTDGLVVGYIYPTASSCTCSWGWLTGQCNGVSVGVAGGNVTVPTSSSGFACASMSNSLVFPVPRGAMWSIGMVVGSLSKSTPAYSFWFVPLGSGQVSLTMLSEAEPQLDAPPAAFSMAMHEGVPPAASGSRTSMGPRAALAKVASSCWSALKGFCSRRILRRTGDAFTS